MTIGMKLGMPAFFANLVILATLANLGCARQSMVYSDPAPAAAAAAVIPVSTDGRAFLPKNFYNQSVNHAGVELQPDGVTSVSKALRFQISPGVSSAGGFNGGGVGSRSLLGLGSWHGRPVQQVEPITFDSKNFVGTEYVGANLQIDLLCDGTKIAVVNAAGSSIALQSNTAVGDGYVRYTASILAAIWLSPTAAIVDPDSLVVLVPAAGSPATLAALLARYPAACLKNASTNALDLPLRVPTAAILISLGNDATITANTTFIRRLTFGSEVFEGFE